MINDDLDLIILGLDGADFSIIDNLIKRGHLKNLKKIIKNGVKAKCKSTLPPITPPAWTSIATGKNPGKTGVFYHLNKFETNSMDFEVVNSSKIKNANPMWDILSRNNVRVGIWNYPLLYPPYPVNGFMVSGLSAPTSKVFTYPLGIQTKFESMCKGDYRITLPIKKYDDPDRFFRDIKTLVNNNRKVLEMMLNKNIDFFFGVISATDFLQHYCWKFIDPDHKFFTPNKHQEKFIDIWNKVDDIIGYIYQNKPKNCKLMIVSDHGFGPENKSFYINKLLEEYNILERRHQLSYYVKKVKRAIFNKFVRRYLNDKTKISNSELGRINKEKSYAINYSAGMACITINKNIIDEENYISFREKLKRIIAKFCKKKNINCNIYNGEDIYKGKYTKYGPDILIEADSFSTVFYRGFKNKIIYDRPNNKKSTGDHRRNGVFLLEGKNVKKNHQLSDFKVYDVAPLALHILNQPIPSDMDGRIFKDIFIENSNDYERKVRYTSEDKEKKKIDKQIEKLKDLDKL